MILLHVPMEYTEMYFVICFCIILIVSPLTFTLWIFYMRVAQQKSGEIDDDDYYFDWRLNIKQTIHYDTLTYWIYGNVFCYLFLHQIDYFTTHFHFVNILYARGTTKKWWGRWWWLLFQLKIKHKTNCSSQYSYLLSIRKCILLFVFASFRLFHHSLSHNQYFICACRNKKVVRPMMMITISIEDKS